MMCLTPPHLLKYPQPETRSESAPVSRLVHIAVGTPGRVCALVTSGALTVDSLTMFVLDEADALLSDSFYPDVTWLYDQLPRKKQVSGPYLEWLG